ncbi:MAG TPA: SusD/RagB family nutrient-binding outer membrane lipoprotein [Mucilaginibacter sp.]|jgi:hypothetical protein|nr:SusD/RagB family nutrient-binding outer membrane lipoprotein [Mucilaginibacter sp.]
MKKYILIISVFFTIGISGCKKDFLSKEVNPNAPSVTTPQLTLAGALGTSASIVVNDYPQYGVWAGYWTTSGNYVPNQDINQYQFTNQSFNGDWFNWYSNLTNYNNLQTVASKDPSLANFQAIAMIMKVYGFQHLVDNYNDVPYTQAFQPLTILFPAYDKGLDIYHDLGKQLDAAIALINKSGATAASPGTSDIVFGTSANVVLEMKNWKKFANSLKLRLAIRVSSKTPGDALVTDLASTASEGYLDGTVEAAANPGYSNTAGKQAPFYGTYGIDATGNPTFGNVYYRANAYSVNTLTGFNDPRVGQLYSLVLPVGAPATNPPSVVHGNVFGDTKATLLTNSNTSGMGPGLLISPAQNAVLFSGAESLFLQAEAAQNAYIPGTAQTLYESGITASFEELGLTAAQAATYYGQAIANVGWASSPNKEQAIITQKWIALNSYFNFEAWNEYRRTGFPALPSSIDPSAISTTLPTRIFYPLSELNTNPTNLAKEGTIDKFNSKIFWAK